MMMSVTPAQIRRLRGVVLKLVGMQHANQRHRYDDYSLLETLERLHFPAHLNLVRTIVQDLIERQCLTAEQVRDRRAGEVAIYKIQITPRGRDILEGTIADAGIAVDVE